MTDQKADEFEFILNRFSRRNMEALIKIGSIRRLRILLEIKEHCNFCTLNALAERLNIPRTTLKTHLEALVEAGLLSYEILPLQDAQQGKSRRQQYCYLITSYANTWFYFLEKLNYQKEMDLVQLDLETDPKDSKTELNINWQGFDIPLQDIPNIFGEMITIQGLFEEFHSMELVLNQAIMNIAKKREEESQSR